MRTNKAFGPPQFSQVLETIGLGAEPLFKLQQCPRKILLHAEEYYMVWLLESSAYPSTIITNPKTGEVMGFTAGLGPSATPIGASGTLSATGTFTLRDLIKLLKDLAKQSEPVPCN
jgi:hypothetical protein